MFPSDMLRPALCLLLLFTGSAYASTRMSLDSNGNIRVNAFATVTVTAASGYVACIFTYRQGA